MKISEDAFKFCRGQCFWHKRTAIGQGAARAVAQRVHVAEHTLWRHRDPPNMQDDLAYRPPSPRVSKFSRPPSFVSVVCECSFSRCLVYTVTLSWSFSRSAVTE